MDLSKEGEIDWSKEKIKKIMKYNSDSKEGKECSKSKHPLSLIDDDGNLANNVCTSSKYCKKCHILYYWD